MQVKLHTTFGPITLELDPSKAPKTVANFASYVNSGHYDGTIFHRVIDGFMIQGGGFDSEMNKRPTQAPIPNEASNGLRNQIGTIAMARTSDPHSATAQFFINVGNNRSLDHVAPTGMGWGYTVFGEVVEGMDVVTRIKSVPTGSAGGHKDVPLEPVMIQRAEIIES